MFEPRVEKWGSGSQVWLGSRHGADVCKTVTLDGSKFTSFGDTIPSGVPLKKAADGGLYEPLTDPSTDELAGFLFTAQPASKGHIVAPMLWHGRVLLDRLPNGVADLSTLTTKNPQFTLEKKEAK